MIKIVILITMIALLFLIGYRWYNKMMNPKPEIAIEGKKKVCCVGDSITFGAGVGNRGHKTLTYPVFLNKILGDEYQVLNCGLTGRTLLAEGDHPYIKETKMYQASLNYKADRYIIMLGTNDSKPYNWNTVEYRSQLKTFTEKYITAAGEAGQVILMYPSKCFIKPGKDKVVFDIDNDVIHNEIGSAVRDVAKELGIQAIDLYSFTENHPEWFDDGVHPNAIGNRKIAEFISNKISL